MSVARELFDLRQGGMYLPAILLFLIQPDLPTIPVVNQPLLPVLAGFSLIAAVLSHGLSRNAFGVGGPEENPQPQDQGKRRMLEAVISNGSDSLPREVLQLIFLFLFYISILIWPFGIIASLYYSTIQINRLDTGVQLILFAEYVWILQFLLWRFFTPIYLDSKEVEEEESIETEKRK
jgi:uncharacterized protein YqhQ